MNINVLHDRNQGLEFCLRIAERFYPGPGGAEWPGFDAQLPEAVRAQAKTAIHAAKAWQQSPILQHYRDVRRLGRRLEKMNEPGLEPLELARACCGCVTEDWVYWSWKASDVAQLVIWQEEGPGSCVELEIFYEIMDLREITGCRLREIISPDCHIEGLDEQFALEQENDLKHDRGGK
jgi:hypothetical protein